MLDRSAPYGTLTDAPAPQATLWGNIFWQGFQDRIDARWSRTTITTTGTQTVVNPSDADILLCNNASDLTIRSLTAPTSLAGGGVPMRRLIIASIGAGHVFLNHQDTSGTTAADRLINCATSGATPLAAGVGIAMYLYDTNSSRWRLVLHEQGTWITPTFAAGDFTGGGSLTWTVAAAAMMKYRLCGRSLRVAFRIVSTSTGGTADSALRIGKAQYGGFTIASVDSRSVIQVRNAGTDAFGQAIASTLLDTDRIILNRDAAGATWSNAASTNTNAIGGVEFEVA